MKTKVWKITFLLFFGITGLIGCSDEEEVEEAVTPEVEEQEEIAEAPEPTPAPQPEPAPVKEIKSAEYAGYEVGNYLYVRTSGLNVRKGPSGKDKVVTKISYGQKVTIWAKQGIWVKINENQWVSMKGLTTQYTYSKSH